MELLGCDSETQAILDKDGKKASFAALICDMLIRSEQKKRRNLKDFMEFFPKKSELYDEYLSILKEKLQETFDKEMRMIIDKMLLICKKLYDFNIIHNDTVYQNIFIKRSKKGNLKCRLIDFDISSSYDPKDNILYVPKYLCFDEDNKRSLISDEEIGEVFDYFINKKSLSLDDVEYIIPRRVGKDIDSENKLIYLSSSKENQKYYDKLWEILQDKSKSHEEKWNLLLN